MAFQEEDLLAPGTDDVDVLGADDDGGVASQARNGVADGLGGDGVETGGGIIKQEDLGRPHQGPRQRHPATLAARQSAGAPLAESAQAERLEHGDDCAVVVTDHGDVVEDVEVSVEGVFGEDHADGGDDASAAAGDAGAEQATQGLQQGALARAAAADQAEPLASLQGKAHWAKKEGGTTSARCAAALVAVLVVEGHAEPVNDDDEFIGASR